ncbi:MAG: hypothetical protein DMF70_05080 [Acidobacteria bacterium]|nr:MAG: hypothetical protein DMF70_05080 [Acidobacteriota bacterium]
MQLDLNQLQARPPDRAAAYDLFRELEFAVLTNEFADGAVATARVASERKYSIIRNQAELDKLIQGLWEAEHVGLAHMASPFRRRGRASRLSSTWKTSPKAKPRPSDLCGTCWVTACWKNPCMI